MTPDLLAPCEPDVFANGEPLCIIIGPRSVTIDAWISTVRAESGQRVDWHMACGYARVLFIGDREAVRATMERLLPQLVAAYLAHPDNFTPPKATDVAIRWM